MARRLSRRQLAQYVAGQLAHNNDGVVRQLAAYLVTTRRTKEVDVLIRDITYYLAEYGTLLTSVTSAFELSDTLKKSVKQFIKASTGAKKIVLEEHSDPSVLGGLKIAIPGKEYDNTIAAQLTTLRTLAKKL